MAARRAMYVINKPANVPPGQLTVEEAAALQDGVARVDPGTDAPSPGDYEIMSMDGVKYWKKRSNLFYARHEGSMQAALAKVPSTGGTVVPDADGPYTVPATGYTIKTKSRITPDGSRAAVFQAPAGASGAGIFKPSNSTGNIHIEGVELDCNGEATMSTGIYLIANDTQHHDIRINDVVIRNALGHGIWSWKTNGLIIDNVQVYDSAYGMRIEDLNGRVRITNAKVINAVASRMQYGLFIGGSLSLDPVDCVITNPTISGANEDPLGNGAGAHGILVTNNPGTRITGGDISNCGDTGVNSGGGIVLGVGSYWSVVEGTILHDNNAPGMWVEIRPGTDFTVGSDRNTNGASISNVHMIENVHGVSCSYSAGTVFTNCHAIGNEQFGFVTDSEGVWFKGCTSYNNWSDAGADATPHHDGNKGGFHLIGGGGSYDDTFSGGVVGCHAYDNRATQLQEYGVCADKGGWTIRDNNLANNDLGGIYIGSNGSTRNNIGGNIGYVNENEGVTSVADGGTIAHGLATTPTRYGAVTTTSGEFVSITAVSSTTLTVAIKTHAGAAGTTQNIAWWAKT